MIKFLHKLFKPNCNCKVCEAPRCEMCDRYEHMLEIEKHEKHLLLDSILMMFKPSEVRESMPVEIAPIRPNRVSWKEQRRIFEEEDRKRFQLMHEQEQDISKLEQELGIKIPEGNSADRESNQIA